MANWIDTESMRTMRVQEAGADETLRVDAFISRQGANGELEDLYVSAINTPNRVQLIYELYVKWFIERQESAALERWIGEHLLDAS